MPYRILFGVLAILAAAGVTSVAQDACGQCPNLAPADAWAELEAGNARFVSGRLKPRADACRVACTKDSQKPYAIVLSCSDSRVPAEIAFDQRIGDVFAVRVAGNVATDEAIGSIEYALEHLKTPTIIVVLGHERCGAVDAALSGEPGHGAGHDRVPSILNRILPAIAGIPPNLPAGARLEEAVQRNVRYTAKLLASSSEVIRRAVTEAHVPIQGAYYSVTSGRVTKVVP